MWRCICCQTVITRKSSGREWAGFPDEYPHYIRFPVCISKHQTAERLEIVEMDKSLTIPTVQRLINKLQKEGIVEVADIVQSGKVLARRYKPVLKSEDYLMDELKETFPMVENRNRFCKNIVGALLNGSEDAKEIIDELEDYLIKKKEEIEKK